MKALTPKILLVTLISVGVGGALITKAIKKGGDAIPPAATEASEATEEISYNPISEIPAKEATNEIRVNAAGAYLINSNEPLYSSRSGKQWPIASVTKLMSALVAKKFIAEEETVTMTEDAVAATGIAGDFKTGEKFKAGDLIQAMLIASSNDAAQALAYHYGEEAFIAKMNQLAGDLEMANTVFADATGLSAGNLSTPDDLSKLVRFIWNEDPGIFAVTRLRSIDLLDINTTRSRKLNNINLFAGRPNFLGGKTGQIPDSSGNLVSIFTLPDKSSPVIIVVLGAEDRFKETEKILIKL